MSEAEAAGDALARLYDLDLAEDPGDLDLYLALAGRTGGPVLELAVGTGRIAVPLAASGVDVTGVDTDPAMLARARRAADAAGLGVARRLRLVEGDARTVRLDDAGAYRLAVIPLNSIFLMGTRRQQADAVATLAAHLAPGGLAVVDAWLTDADDLSRYDGRLSLEWVREEPGTGRTVTKTGERDLRPGVERRPPDDDLRGVGARARPRRGGCAWTGCASSGRTTWSPSPRPRASSSRSSRATTTSVRWRRARSASCWSRGAPDHPSGVGRRASGHHPGGPRRWDHRGRERGPAVRGRVGPMPDQLRLLVVEDVPQVAQYIRGLLNTQSTIKLLDVVTDGSRVAGLVSELRPDVVLIDALLQGRVKGMNLVDQLNQSGAGIPVIVLTVPQQPVAVDPRQGIHGVLSMPFTGYELVTRLQQVNQAAAASEHSGSARMITIFAPKGGVGKTTLAFNLAVAMGLQGPRTVLIDGSLQFGDMRALLKVPIDAPSLLDLPTDRIQESDLQDVLWRDPSGIDILLAPPRVEMAEMVTVRDLEKTISLLRRVYDVVVVDTPAVVNDINLSFLDASDTILEVVTYDSTTIHSTMVMADAFRMIGYPPTKVRYLVNRADSTGGFDPETLSRALGRVPEHTVSSGGALVVRANNEGIPFVLADPEAPISQDLARIAAELVGRVPAAATRR